MNKQEWESSKLIAQSTEYNFGNELDGLAGHGQVVQHGHRAGLYVSNYTYMSLGEKPHYLADPSGFFNDFNHRLK